MKKKELFFSITAKDCDWDFKRGSGAGGQHRNKTESACRCVHRASGAVGYAEDDRSQHRNKQLAFQRMAKSDKFKKWIKIEKARKNGELAEIEENVKKALLFNTKVESRNEKGRWEEDENLKITSYDNI